MIPQFKKNEGFYSTDEKIIGKWIDEKDVYKKVITNLGDIASNHWSTTDISSLNIDTIIDVSGKLKVINTSNKESIQDINRVVPDGVETWSIGIGDISTKSIGILFGTGYKSIVSGFLIVKYTKKD